MFKKLAAIVMAAGLMFGLAACNDNGTVEQKQYCESNGGRYVRDTNTGDMYCNLTTR